LVVITDIEGLPEAVVIVYKRYLISTAMTPQVHYIIIRNLLAHPKDKVNTQETAECVLKIPRYCINCQKVYIGEQEHSFGIYMKEHQKEVKDGNTPEVQGDNRNQSVTSLRSLITSTQKIASSGTRQQSLFASLTGLCVRSGRQS